jgi:hypothetical protein
LRAPEQAGRKIRVSFTLCLSFCQGIPALRRFGLIGRP